MALCFFWDRRHKKACHISFYREGENEVVANAILPAAAGGEFRRRRLLSRWRELRTQNMIMNRG